MKYYRDRDGFVYKKSGENSKTVCLDYLREPNCICGARYHKNTHELELISQHSDEKPNEHVIFKFAFEEFLKNESRKSENAKVSVLNLYKRAKCTVFAGIWLPLNHQTLFLAKLRRIRQYETKEKQKVKSQKNRFNPVSNQTVDVATSPTIPQSMILQRILYSSSDAQDSSQQNSISNSNAIPVIPRQNSTPAKTSSADAITSPILPSPIHNENVASSKSSLILQRMAHSPKNNNDNSNSIGILTPPIQFRNGTHDFATSLFGWRELRGKFTSQCNSELSHGKD